MGVLNVLVVMLHCALVINGDGATEYGYKGDKGLDMWKDISATCGTGTKQSPIDIKTADVKQMKYDAFTFVNFDKKKKFTLKNTGTTAEASYGSSDIMVKAGGLPNGTYKVTQFHMHWGKDDNKGAEHMVEGKSFPMELHIVTMNEKMAGSLAVLGVLFEVDTKDNAALKVITDKLSTLKTPSDTGASIELMLDSIMPEDKTMFYRYNGSLTTPGCSEGVVWTLFKNTIKISKAQLGLFRMLDSKVMDSSNTTLKLVDNFRPVQKLNGRKVMSNFVVGKGGDMNTAATIIVSPMLNVVLPLVALLATAFVVV